MTLSGCFGQATSENMPFDCQRDQEGNDTLRLGIEPRQIGETRHAPRRSLSRPSSRVTFPEVGRHSTGDVAA
jgi:hypothetical protein